jgi:hypothetical protein
MILVLRGFNFVEAMGVEDGDEWVMVRNVGVL